VVRGDSPPASLETLSYGEKTREKSGSVRIPPPVHSKPQCCANLAQGGGFLGAFRVPVEDSALRQIRATSSREKAGRLTGSALFRGSVSPAKRVVNLRLHLIDV
jgi:hypothetical protein